MTIRNKLATALIPLLLAGTAAVALDTVPGSQFIETWDYDGDGQVTLAEAAEHRSDMFYSFDADENGILDMAELSLLSETRDGMRDGRDHGSDQMQMMQAQGQGKDQGQGKGPGWLMMQGQGHGQMAQAGQMGHGMQGQGQAGHDFTAPVTLEAFLDQTNSWFAQKDRNGDGILTSADFGRKF